MMNKYILTTATVILFCALAYGQPDVPPPPVPLDGGLLALLAAGGITGYKAYAKKNK